MIFVHLIKFMFALFSAPGCGQHIERKCFSRDSPIGKYLGVDYQIVYVMEKHFVELECQACNETVPLGMNATWSLIQMNNTAINPVYDPFKPKSKKFKKHMKILENNTLFIDKVKTKHGGLYSCNTTHLDPTDNSTIISLSYNYLMQVNEKEAMSELPSGSLTDWNKYRENVLAVAATRLDDESLEDQIAGLDVMWSNWSKCLCGTYKFDTRRFRFAYPFLTVNDNERMKPIFPTHSVWLKHFYPFFSNIVENVTIFNEYERCVGNCVPDALELDVNYKYEESIYISEGSDMTFICPDVQNASETIWVLNEETVLEKRSHSLGTGDEENHVAVDMLDELHLLKVRESEAGTYSCIVDATPIKKITVTVIPKSIFLTKDFLNCILTIAYVLICCFIVCLFILCMKIYHIYSWYEK